MSFLFRRKRLFVFISLLLFSVIPFAFRSNSDIQNKTHVSEAYNPKLNSINNIESAVDYINNEYNKHNLSGFDTVKYVQIVSKFTKERFYHGLSHYSFGDNWILFLSGKLFWSHVSAIVNPNDILKYSEALCSQQTIVFMDILTKKGINVRTVGLGYKEGPGHFLAEVYYSGKWHLYDVTLEPDWKKIVAHHESMEYYMNNKDTLYAVYNNSLNRSVFDKILNKVNYGEINEFPANNMLLLHRFTFLLIYCLPVVLLILLIKTIKGL